MDAECPRAFKGCGLYYPSVKRFITHTYCTRTDLEDGHEGERGREEETGLFFKQIKSVILFTTDPAATVCL